MKGSEELEGALGEELGLSLGSDLAVDFYAGDGRHGEEDGGG